MHRFGIPLRWAATKNAPREAALELDILISGIGGQGVQLVGKVLALAATAMGRHVMLSGDYGGQMRGGSTVATLVIGDQRLRALPIIPSAGCAIALHHKFWENVGPRLRPGSLVVAEDGIAGDLPDMARHRLLRIPATEIALAAGNRMAAGMAIMGAFAALTDSVTIEALVTAMAEQIPPYRRQHIETNEKAIRAGAAHALAMQEAAA
ncbi:2-oxoacid:acceptor oxidoreductase family protein [Terrarubrum flagellatum]|uniref:2-oxoacid:acceptor oxidoreductase family protein n=1 Tax=Terrirubrum flagellatum TaxID=2895980 RepID=UPI003144FC49